MSMQPGAWVMANFGFTFMTTDCGVTPHGQNGHLALVDVDRIAEIGLGDIVDADDRQVADVNRCAVDLRNGARNL